MPVWMLIGFKHEIAEHEFGWYHPNIVGNLSQRQVLIAYDGNETKRVARHLAYPSERVGNVAHAIYHNDFNAVGFSRSDGDSTVWTVHASRKCDHYLINRSTRSGRLKRDRNTGR